MGAVSRGGHLTLNGSCDDVKTGIINRANKQVSVDWRQSVSKSLNTTCLILYQIQPSPPNSVD